MKDMIKKVREERGGFTLAELLIVVAIIMVLVAIAIPVFSGAMERANLSVAEGDVRAVKSAAATKYLLTGETGDDAETVFTGTIVKGGDVTGIVEGDGGTYDFSGTADRDEVMKDLANDLSDDANYPLTITVEITETDLDLD